ncbi:glycoside hydrolase family 108 protein [Rhodopila sp.]|uniref:glycoside hydrolase family 108 protein n=1 Tax=Rhodopila sp. TaxID=2480087 RepID=UPI003D0AEDEB
MDAFEPSFAIVVGHEGGYTANPSDPGNWTGGRCGVGDCHGTNWGISAAAYPQLDIHELGLSEAHEIYRRDYWNSAQCDKLPAPLALLVFDAAVNNGVSQAIRWLQAALGVAQDGVAGPGTIQAINAQANRVQALCAEFQSSRLMFMTGLSGWRTFGNGWSRRLCTLPFQAMQLGVV